MSDDATRDAMRDDIAARVKAEMARRNITQRSLAAAIGVAQPHLSTRLAGDRAFRAEELVRIARYLDVPLEVLAPTTGPVDEQVSA